MLTHPAFRLSVRHSAKIFVWLLCCAGYFQIHAHAQEISQPVLSLPAAIQNGDTILLDCGRIYSGQLDLRGRQQVKLLTRGRCGPAAITPAVPVTGWKRNGTIWSAPLDFTPSMLQIEEAFVPLAHHPNSTTDWLKGEAKGVDSLRVAVNAHNLRGAILVWRAEDWLILKQTVADHEKGILRIAEPSPEGFRFPDKTPFYLEGQRWMLDAPDEWIYEQGRLYVWPKDGRSPEGRAWAASPATAIDARGSSDVLIDGVRIFLATRGIDGSQSHNLAITNTRISNSEEEAIRIGGHGTKISRTHIEGSVQHGIRAEDDARHVSITDSLIENTGMLGMPKRSKGAIVFEQASGHYIARNRIRNAAYIGIRVFRDSVTENNQILQACQRMTDCGGIYTFARDRQPLRARIENNRISGLQGRLSHAIYLDDFANDVIVRNNQMTDNPGAMQLHNAFDNLITDNVFRRSTYEHILLNETAPFAAISGNQISNNHFFSANEAPVYRLWSHHGSAHLLRFAEFSRNRYIANQQRFAELEGKGWVTASDWMARMSDTVSIVSPSGTFPQLTRQRQQKKRVGH